MQDIFLRELQQQYEQKNPIIETRWREFEEVFQRGDEAIFAELCFCLFTAGSSARTGLKSIDAIRDILMTGSMEELSERLKGIHQYGKRRAEYVVLAREFVQCELDFKLKGTIESFCGDAEGRRDFIIQNIKGLGYKESSHFLRNIGFRGYAILDRHILRNLRRFGVTAETSTPSSKKRYLKVEEQMKAFAEEIGIDFDDLDFVFWSHETGEILK